MDEPGLIEGARNGDRASQEALVKLYERRAFGLILRLVGNREDARDILQDTMVNALRSLHTYDESHPFAAWLFRIGTNKAIDFLRKRKTELRLFAYEGEMPAGDRGERTALAETAAYADPSPLADERVAQRIRWSVVERCMGELEPRYRAVLFLRYKEALSYEEISQALSIPMGTVKILLHRGRNQLKAKVLKEVGAS